MLFSKTSLLCGGWLAVFALAGCNFSQNFRVERARQALLHFDRAQKSTLGEIKKFTLQDCVDIALKQNLDLQLSQLEQGIAREARTAEMLGMLPSLTVSDAWGARSNTPAASSEKVDPKGLTYGYSASSERQANVFNVEAALGVLDFGLACFNTQQAHNRISLAKLRTLRLMQNITLDVQRAYIRMAVAQRSMTLYRQAIADSQTRYASFSELQRAGKIAPSRAFDEARDLAAMERRLAVCAGEYDAACVELRRLMGLYPGESVSIDESLLNASPQLNLPGIELMEQIALLQRPELYEGDLQKEINLIECRKKLLLLFPNVRLFASFTDSTDRFLYNSSWWDLGLRAAYDLFQTPQNYRRYKIAKLENETDDLRAYAKAIGVMAQVRLAHSTLLAAEDLNGVNTRLCKRLDADLDYAREHIAEEVTPVFQVELDHITRITLEARIEQCRSTGESHAAFYQLINILGMKNLERATFDALEGELRLATIRASAALRTAQAETDRRYGRLAQNDLFIDPARFVPEVTPNPYGFTAAWTPWL